MTNRFSIQYWLEGGWYIGEIVGYDGVFSQAKRLKELKRNLLDALIMMSKATP